MFHEYFRLDFRICFRLVFVFSYRKIFLMVLIFYGQVLNNVNAAKINWLFLVYMEISHYLCGKIKK